MNSSNPTPEDQDNAKYKPIVYVNDRRITNIPIAGMKDPRGPDNNVLAWVDKEGLLHIRVWKTNRCYKFKEVMETNGYVEVIAE